MSFRYLSEPINYEEIIEKSRLSPELKQLKDRRDKELEKIIRGEDSRFLVIIGPCSAHDENAVCEYAVRLAKIQEKVSGQLFLVPRVYTNKPRTTGEGYKGMLHQPDINKKPDMIKGIEAIRQMHRRVIGESGLTTADEMLYPENLIYIQDLLSYIAIGARSVENQQHRFVASGIDCPVGMKNPTSGDINVLFNSIQAARTKQHIIYNCREVETSVNELAHVVLRGSVDRQGRSIPNYHYEDIMRVIGIYNERDIGNPFIVIDTNHDNSEKKFYEQIRIAKEVLSNRSWNDDMKRIVRGFMIESFLESGKQGEKENTYGKSITDPCLGWDDTERLLYYIAEHI